MSAAKVNIVSGFLDDEERAVIAELCNKRNSKLIWVAPFRRWGKSGAELLLAFFNDKPRGAPYLIKIAQVSKLIREKDGIGVMRNWLPELSVEAEYLPTDVNKKGGFLMRNVAGDNQESASNPISLRDKILNPSQILTTHETSSYVRDVFKTLEEAHVGSSSKFEEINIAKHYRQYFRKDVGRPLMECFLGRQKDAKMINLSGQDLINPIHVRDSLPETVRSAVGNVHGDLHTDNVILHERYGARLVDFGWSGEPRDILLDFVLMENSIRFRDSPRYLALEDQCEAERCFLDFDPLTAFDENRFSNNTAAVAYKLLCSSVSEIRRAAAQVYERLDEGFSMDRYFLTQFIVLYGLQKYEFYDMTSSMRFMGQIGERILSYSKK